MSSLIRGLALLTGISAVVASPVERATCSTVWAGQTVTGTEVTSGVCRYTVKYGTADRWADSVAATTQNGVATTQLPPSCPQPQNDMDGATQSEDCLYVVVYAPLARSGLPVMVWLHGGSFIYGSASAPGLDGSAFVKAGNVVVVPQYRLGALGMLAPSAAPQSGDPNFAVRDVILALNTVKNNIACVGGDKTRVTLAGHSSGAHMIRALWGAPAAKGLFHRMIMQSDPMMYGLQSTRVAGLLKNKLFSDPIFANCNSLADFRAVNVDSVTQAEINQLFVNPQFIDPSVPQNSPMRPTFGAATIPNESINSLYYNPGALGGITPSSVPLLITTVKDEAAGLANDMPDALVSSGTFSSFLFVLSSMVGQQRAATISLKYDFPRSNGDIRSAISLIATDGVFRCAARGAATKYAAAGGKAYVAEFRQGTQYPDNVPRAFCAGKVCHEDDIFPTFHHGSGAFEDNITTMWSNFMKNGNPGSGWNAFTASTGQTGTNVRALGGDGVVSTCPANYWGNTVKWDWQYYAA